MAESRAWQFLLLLLRAVGLRLKRWGDALLAAAPADGRGIEPARAAGAPPDWLERTTRAAPPDWSERAAADAPAAPRLPLRTVQRNWPRWTRALIRPARTARALFAAPATPDQAATRPRDVSAPIPARDEPRPAFPAAWRVPRAAAPWPIRAQTAPRARAEFAKRAASEIAPPAQHRTRTPASASIPIEWGMTPQRTHATARAPHGAPSPPAAATTTAAWTATLGQSAQPERLPPAITAHPPDRAAPVRRTLPAPAASPFEPTLPTPVAPRRAKQPIATPPSASAPRYAAVAEPWPPLPAWPPEPDTDADADAEAASPREQEHLRRIDMEQRGHGWNGLRF